MSLAGNLKDLGLEDILQIIHLGRKTGILHLHHNNDTGKIYVDQGLIISAANGGRITHTMRQFIQQHQLMDEGRLDEAVKKFEYAANQGDFIDFLESSYAINRAPLDEWCRSQIKQTISDMADWHSGSFNLVLQDDIRHVLCALSTSVPLCLAGLNPQYVAMEKYKLQDEVAHQEQSQKSQMPHHIPKQMEPQEHKEKLVDMIQELSKELKEVEQTIQLDDKVYVDTSPGLLSLKSALNELNMSAQDKKVSLLILRYASEFFSRAVLFAVNQQNLAMGLGQYGVVFPQGDASENIRSTMLPLKEVSIIQEAFSSQLPVCRPLNGNEWDTYLVNQLGGEMPKEAFAAPILSRGRIAALLYADNLPDKKPIGDTTCLEIFLTQAGIVLEKALLERQLEVQ